MASNEIFEAYKGFDNSLVGKHLQEWVQAEHDRLIDKAEKCNDPQEAYGYLKTAFGIIKVNEHIKTMSSGT